MLREDLAARLAARRARIVAALQALPDGDAGARLRTAWDAVKRRPDAVVAVVLAVGVLVMILHWR